MSPFKEKKVWGKTRRKNKKRKLANRVANQHKSPLRRKGRRRKEAKLREAGKKGLQRPK